MGALLTVFYIDRPNFGRSSISPVFTHVINLIRGVRIKSILGDKNWQVSL